MSVEYDLIILGATPAGIHAAISAASLKARVALVTQGISSSSATEETHYHALLEVAQTVAQVRHNLAAPWWAMSSAIAPLKWEAMHQWRQMVALNLNTLRSSPSLAYRGIDVIFGMGEFCRKPARGVVAEGRFMQARAYLLATGHQSAQPAIDGLESVGYLTSETLPLGLNFQQKLDVKNPHLVILGSGKTAVELAQSLTQLGIAITLIAGNSLLLPDLDREVVHWIKAQLEGVGVRVITNIPVQQVRSHANQKVIQVGQQTIQADEIIVAVGHSPNVASLNLEAVGVRWTAQGIWHSDSLQTTNSRIYTCEGRVGLECWTQAAIHEATIAVKNALFGSWFKPNYPSIPLTIRAPELAWVGLTEAQAMERFGKNAIVLQRSFNTLLKAQYTNDLTGFCKLILHRNGSLLGAHLLGAQSSETINILALAMQQRLKVKALGTLVPPSSTFAEIIHQTAQDYRQMRFQRNSFLWQDLLDHWFDLRRAWSRP